MKKTIQFIYNIYQITFTKVIQVIGNDTYNSYEIHLTLVKQCDNAKDAKNFLNIKEFNGINHGYNVDKAKNDYIAKAIHTAKGYTVIKDSVKTLESVK